MSRTSPSQKDLQNGRHGGENISVGRPGSMDYLEHVASSFNIPSVPLTCPNLLGTLNVVINI